jgi:transcription-repair coupling factor (superfamily II helicase)
LHALAEFANPFSAALSQPPVIVTSARALMTRTLPRREFLTHTRTLKVGQAVRLEKLLETWVEIGYSVESIVVEPGQFSRRGGIVDIYPMADELPARLELFGDEIETIRRFDPAQQRSGEKIESLTITPAREGLPKFRRGPSAEDGSPASPALLEFEIPLMYPPASLIEYLPEKALVLVDDWQELADTVNELEEHAVQLRREQVEAGLLPDDFPVPYLTWSEVEDELADHTLGFLGPRTDEDVPAIPLGEGFQPGPRFGGQLKPVLEHLQTVHENRERAVVVSRQALRLAELWGQGNAPVMVTENVKAPPTPGEIVFVEGALSDGWRVETWHSSPGGEAERDATSLHLLTDAEIFGWSRALPRRRQRRAAAAAPETRYADFTPGDFVVHEDYGIGRFREMVKRSIDGLEREYLLLEYAEGDELYVPVYQTDRLTRYVGTDENPPALSRLGSAEWQNVKSRAKQAVEEMARELLDLYARREVSPGRPFSVDTPWQSELEGAFPFVETEDQLGAIRDVKADMEKPRPMDRLICGDVGFGKTEVALRAAFKAIMDGTQVAILVPTTVLAQQHFHTLKTRFAPYPIQVEMLSRFRSPAEVRTILHQMAEGQIDVIVGTHRLLQKDVEFKNLGLLIVDEEQRFGVTHKERLKRLRTEVDVLTLTATPIPRTLYMALTGIRDISTINTPPEERLPIITHVGPYNERLVRQAILRELDRGGQVFFLHNRVQSIGIVQHRLEQLVPEARIGMAHGQMEEKQLSRMMDEFSDGQIDLLLCTSIIESGLDIPNANTLIVDRADTFGLAQLYQLRGRVGRSAAQAYAYFFTDKHHRPTPEARERLETLAEQTDLGAGYSIAMRDLEMRGAGDIIGPKQSGQITAVGFHLYTRLLGQAVKKIKAQVPALTPQEEPTVGALARDAGVGLGISTTVDLPLAISIPSEYVDNRDLRLQLYRRLANITEEADLDAITLELADRFGPIPRPMENLIYQLRVKLRAARAGVLAVGSESGQIVLTMPPLDELDQAYYANVLLQGARASKNRIWLPRMTGEADWRERLLDVLAKLEAEKEKKPLATA